MLQPTAVNDHVYLTNDVCKRTGLAPATVRLYEKLGLLPAIRTVGGVRLFSRVAVEAFLAARANHARPAR
jgi:DNA-binding transcriptional MerR regulator